MVDEGLYLFNCISLSIRLVSPKCQTYYCGIKVYELITVESSFTFTLQKFHRKFG